jgi:anti-anti-sigma factor
MRHTITDQNGTVIVRLQGDMDGGAGDAQVYDAVYRCLGEGRRRFVIDLAAVEEMNAVGLGVVLTLLAIVRNGSGTAILARLPDVVTSLLIITQWRDVLPTADTVDAAVERLTTSASDTEAV